MAQLGYRGDTNLTGWIGVSSTGSANLRRCLHNLTACPIATNNTPLLLPLADSPLPGTCRWVAGDTPEAWRLGNPLDA